MILIISDRNDIHTQKVESVLKNESVKFLKLNVDVESLKNTIVKFDGNNWEINTLDGSFNTDEISVIWSRRTYVELLLEEYDINEAGFKIWKGEWNKTLLGIYSALESKKWLNFYRDAYYAENKYRQYSVARKMDLRIPNFICSNDKIFLANQFNDTEKVIKFMNQEFFRTEKGLYKGIYVNKISITDLTKFSELGENPIILQDYIQKKYEVRYTVVGDDHFVCMIESQLSKIADTDWRRYDLANTPHSIIVPPEDIKEKITNFMRNFNLNYGAIDFIVSKDNDWYFLELNSMGQFLWIEDLTGLEISQSIAKWLINNN